MYPADAGSSQAPQQGHKPHRQSWDPSNSQHYRSEQAYPPHPPSHLNGSYPHPADQQRPPSAPPQIRPDRPEMAAIHHNPYPYSQQPAPYHLPAPAGLYPHQPPDYRPPPAHQPPPQQQTGQSAPRQRTAIACKYCRRRKIRCSGFENSEDGRCSNCVRFSQECVFTPVSAQTQAFVPAQALYGRGRGGPIPGQPQQLYGPYGNRLPSHHDPYAQQPPPPPPPPSHNTGYTLPSPAAYPPQPGQPYYPPHPSYDPAPPGGRRRPRDEPQHLATAPPPNPGLTASLADHRDSHGGPPPGYAYPDPQGYSHSGPPPPPPPGYQGHPQPYYASEPGRRHSPNSAYSYDPNRHSQSPHGPSYGYPPAGSPGQPPYSSGPPPPASAGGANRTPPPTLGSSERGRSGMSIHDMVGGSDGASGGSGERSHADNDMVSKLNRSTAR